MAETERDTTETSFLAYWKECGNQFIADTIPWIRDNILLGVLLLLIPPLVVWIKNRNASLDWDTVKTTLYCYAIILAVYVVIHGVRTPWKVHQHHERIHRALQETVREWGRTAPPKNRDWGGEWNLVEQGFRRLASSTIRAERQMNAFYASEQWRLTGEDAFTKGDCEAWCIRAGALLIASPGIRDNLSSEVGSHAIDDLTRWLRFLMERYALSNVLVAQGTDKSTGISHVTTVGAILRLPLVSASECVRCAAATFKE